MWILSVNFLSRSLTMEEKEQGRDSGMNEKLKMGKLTMFSMKSLDHV